MKYLLLLAAILAVASSQFVNKEVTRKLAATSQLLKEDIQIQLEATENVSKYQIWIEAEAASHLAKITGRYDGKSVSLVSKPTKEPGIKLFVAKLGKGISSGSSGTLKIKMVYTHILEPFPKQIGQKDEQFVLLKSNMYFYTPYHTLTQTTEVVLSSSTILSKTEIDDLEWSKETKTLTYGPFEDVEPRSSKDLSVHFENGAPFLVLTEVLREIEVSHWGNVAVEEHIDVKHGGAVLKGEWSRLDYQMLGQDRKGPSFRTLTAALPEFAADMYYRDVIGNISTSTLEMTEEGVDMKMDMRFPMFGGWKSQFYYGYNSPLDVRLAGGRFNNTLQGFVVEKEGKYVVKAEVATHIKGAVTDNLVVKIILPAGASDVDVSVPFEMEQEETFRATYFDWAKLRRPVVILKAKNLVGNQGMLEVSYSYTTFDLLLKPILVACGFFSLLVFIWVALRLCKVFSFSKPHTE